MDNLCASLIHIQHCIIILSIKEMDEPSIDSTCMFFNDTFEDNSVSYSTPGSKQVANQSLVQIQQHSLMYAI